ncbi:hypothetical protein JXA32_16175 [Candidatus Sumerlaeota bacterium]|nr:hypothetical protein [Candidatus Sumerlaeota bacterium]
MKTSERYATDSALMIIASLAIAFIIWYIAKQGDVETSYLRIPIVFEEAMPEIEISAETLEARVAVHYPKTYARWIDKANFSLRVELDGLKRKAGVDEFRESVYPVYPSMIQRKGVPDVVIVREIENPREVRLLSRWRLARGVIQPEAQGQPAPDYEIAGGIALDPAEIWLTGSASALKQWTDPVTGQIALKTDSISVTNASSELKGKVNVSIPPGLSLFDPDKRDIDPAASIAVSYNAPIAEKMGERRIANVQIRISTLSQKVKISALPEEGQALATGPVRLLNQIKREYIKFKPRTPLDETMDFTGQVAVEAIWADETPEPIRAAVKLSEAKPEAVTVTLTVTPEAIEPAEIEPIGAEN